MPEERGTPKKLALVIGNGAYAMCGLRNARGDAEVVAAKLEKLGFTVVLGVDLDHEGFVDTVVAFDALAPSAEVSVFFYAGHGIQFEDQNYLLPINIKGQAAREVLLRSFSLERVLPSLVQRSETSIVFLDACRDNPFISVLGEGRPRTREFGSGAGLASMEAEAGLLIAYATGPGEVALDGDGEHSPFTTALLEHLETPNLSVVDLMIDVRNHVLELTNNRQKPWDRSSLTKRFCFVTGAPAIAPAASVAEEWAAIQNGTSPGILANFAARYPFEPWNRYAEMRIAELRESDRKLTTASKVIDAYDTPIPRLEQLVNSRKGELGGGGMIGHAELARLIQIATRSTARLLRRSGQPLASSFVVRGSDLAAELGDRLYVMTAGHAVSAGQHGFAAGPGDVMVLFPGLGDGPIPVKRVVWESPPREYDTALLELEIELSGEFRPLRLAKDLPALDPARNTMRGLPRVVSISYPFGGEVQFGLTASLLDYQRPTRDASGSPVREPVWIHYTAQTEPGSSGCPILDERLEVIAVHSRGMHNLPRLNGGDGTYAANAGVWIHSIAAAIKSSPDSNGGHGGRPQFE